MTHGLCGKEGAMVFKRVLKGIGRLMLTTAVMCGVGLFLCSSEVKAASVTLTQGTNEGDFKVTVNSDDPNDKIKSLESVKLYKGNEIIYSIDNLSATNTPETPVTSYDYTVSKDEFIKGIGIKDSAISGNKIEINDVGITYVDTNGLESSEIKLSSQLQSAIESAPIYKVDVTNDTAYGDVTFKPNFTYEVNGRNMPYGYEGEEYTVTPSWQDYYLKNYYSLIRKQSDTSQISPDDQNWKSANLIEGRISNKEDDNELKVAYLPKIKSLKITAATGGTLNDTKDRLNVLTDSTDTVYSNVSFEIDEFSEGKESIAKNKALTYYNLSLSCNSPDNSLGHLKAEYVTGVDFTLEMKLIDTNTNGSGIVKIGAGVGNNPDDQDLFKSINLGVNLGVKPKTLLLQNVPISLIAGGEKKTLKIFKGVEPSGANQDPSSYTASLNVATPRVLDGNEKFNPSTGEITVKASSTAAAGSNTEVTLTLTDKFNNVVSQSFNVKIISFDKEKTISSINKNNKNYITYNKDKGYSLDIKQLIVDNAKDSSGNSITIDKNQITDVKVGSTYCSEGTWKPSEASLNQKVSCKINSVEIKESDGLTVSSYPMPTATYSSSNRTLSVKIPTKVATAYSDDNNIRTSKGFKLLLEDSSGNTLYEYTDSKYQSVLSSSSESTVTYTVPAADIEGMVTSAASNGKFSADTTSVKFKVIPMGYKQSSTSDETIKAKDEIAGKTDAVTVYKVSASGTNFTSSAAYGLDGQTVSITATPNSGYSFKQWSDGNTSNPRQVKVSASGTRSFQAVAGDRVANSTGAGGTDNSELYDDVPKTAESNSAIWLIVFMVFAVMGTTYALYLQLKAANSKHDR